MANCKWCDAPEDDHDYQQLARECYPKQIDALKESLRHALAQWKMYAEFESDRDLDGEQTTEAALYRDILAEAA